MIRCAAVFQLPCGCHQPCPRVEAENRLGLSRSDLQCAACGRCIIFKMTVARDDIEPINIGKRVYRFVRQDSDAGTGPNRRTIQAVELPSIRRLARKAVRSAQRFKRVGEAKI